MKKVTLAFILLLLQVSLIACGNATANEATEDKEQVEVATTFAQKDSNDTQTTAFIKENDKATKSNMVNASETTAGAKEATANEKTSEAEKNNEENSKESNDNQEGNSNNEAENAPQTEFEVIPDSERENIQEETGGNSNQGNEGTSSDNHEHNFIYWKYLSYATCAKEGKRLRKCTCGYTYEETIPATGKHQYIKNKTKFATCETPERILYKCSRCDASYEEQSKPALGHDIGENGKCKNCSYIELASHTHEYKDEVTTRPTCQSEGVRTYKCLCGDSYTETIDICRHFGKWIDNGGYWKYTSACYACHEPFFLDTEEGLAAYEAHQSQRGPCFLAGSYFPVSVWVGPPATYECKWCGIRRDVQVYHVFDIPGYIPEDYFD